MLGANSQQKWAKGRTIGVNELGSNNEMDMQIDDLTESNSLLPRNYQPRPMNYPYANTYNLEKLSQFRLED